MGLQMIFFSSGQFVWSTNSDRSLKRTYGTANLEHPETDKNGTAVSEKYVSGIHILAKSIEKYNEYRRLFK